jgi:hypothetical protein
MSRPTAVKHQINTNPLTTLATFQYDDLGRLSKKFVAPGAVNYPFNSTFEISKQNGNWPDNTTWKSNNVPNTDDISFINPGHSVNFTNGQIGTSGKVENNGILNLGTNGTLNLDGTITATTSNIPLDYLQVINYTYHVRGWLKGINENLSIGEGDLFSYKIDYEKAGYFDGNIGKITWRSPKDLTDFEQPERSYAFTYDKASRLKTASFTGKPGEDFSLPTLNYTANGNILNLTRKGKNNASLNSIIDQLTYHYDGNRLNYVEDAISGNENVGDFRDTFTGNIDYTYHNDGRLNADKNEGIDGISYNNYLKQPEVLSLSGGRTILARVNY